MTKGIVVKLKTDGQQRGRIGGGSGSSPVPQQRCGILASSAAAAAGAGAGAGAAPAPARRSGCSRQHLQPDGLPHLSVGLDVVGTLLRVLQDLLARRLGCDVCQRKPPQRVVERLLRRVVSLLSCLLVGTHIGVDTRRRRGRRCRRGHHGVRGRPLRREGGREAGKDHLRRARRRREGACVRQVAHVRQPQQPRDHAQGARARVARVGAEGGALESGRGGEGGGAVEGTLLGRLDEVAAGLPGGLFRYAAQEQLVGARVRVAPHQEKRDGGHAPVGGKHDAPVRLPGLLRRRRLRVGRRRRRR
eukprot:Rhum_TRINITY_DN14321_c19_g1::Rhum_TRINITY_DN14321_c19_g1_i1::g.81502::m.81502